MRGAARLRAAAQETCARCPHACGSELIQWFKRTNCTFAYRLINPFLIQLTVLAFSLGTLELLVQRERSGADGIGQALDLIHGGGA